MQGLVYPLRNHYYHVILIITTIVTITGVFLRDFTLFSESDKYCNFCSNLWVLPSITPESKIYEESLAYIEGCFHAHLDPANHYFNETHDITIDNEKK